MPPFALSALDLVILRAVLVIEGIFTSLTLDQDELGSKFAETFRDRKIYAIKQVRLVAGLSLVESKNFVERILTIYPPLPANAVLRSDVIRIREIAEEVDADVRAGILDHNTRTTVDELLSAIDKALGV